MFWEDYSDFRGHASIMYSGLRWELGGPSTIGGVFV